MTTIEEIRGDYRAAQWRSFWHIVTMVVVGLFWLIAYLTGAHAADLCTPLEGVKATSEKYHGQWVEVTANEWEFLRGIFAMNPETPPGLPFGDKAFLSIPPGGNDDGAIVFFIDGDQACTPMKAPKKLLDLLATVAAGRIEHQGHPL